MVRVTLTKTEASGGSLFPVGIEVEGILVDKKGAFLDIEALLEQKEGVFLKVPNALTNFSERPYHFATGKVVGISKQDDAYLIETVSGKFSLREKPLD